MRRSLSTYIRYQNMSDNRCISQISDMFLRLCNICGIWSSQMRRSLSIYNILYILYIQCSYGFAIRVVSIWSSQMRRSLSITELCPMTTLSHNRKAAPLDHSDDDGDDEEYLWYIAHFAPVALCRLPLYRCVDPCFAIFLFFLVFSCWATSSVTGSPWICAGCK